MDGSFCLAALREALSRFGRPEILNTDRAASSPSAAFTGTLMAAGVRVSMDGRGRWMDNVFIERLWRSLKHEDIYLKGYADGREAHSGIAAWFAFYNTGRPHQGLGNKMPMTVWREAMSGPLGQTVDMNGQRKSVAHMPTAETATAATRGYVQRRSLPELQGAEIEATQRRTVCFESSQTESELRLRIWGISHCKGGRPMSSNESC
jgi:putative transposase